MRLKTLLTVALAAGALLVCAGPAVAAPSGDPVRFWSVSEVEQGAGKVLMASGAQASGTLHKVVGIGHSVFELGHGFRGFGEAFSSATGAKYWVAAAAPSFRLSEPRAEKGGVVHLDEYQAYEKRASDASLRISIDDVFLKTGDTTGLPDPPACPPDAECEPLRAVVRFRARAYAESAGGDFFNVGGTLYLEGYKHHWSVGAANLSDSHAPFWGNTHFFVDTDVGRDKSGTEESVQYDVQRVNRKILPPRPRVLTVPLATVHTGELFAVHVSMEAEAINDRGIEAVASAYIQDPQHLGPGLFTAHDLKPRGAPRFNEPPAKQPPAARCSAGPRPHAGTLQLSDAAYTVGEASGTPLVLVKRMGGARGAATVTVHASGGSAEPGRDFKPTTARVTFGDGDTSPRLVEIPISEDQAVEAPETFTVSLSHPLCAKLGRQRDAAVTILDDDGTPAASGSAPAFTIGGSVTGLEGSGLVLTDLISDLPIAGDGSFTPSSDPLHRRGLRRPGQGGTAQPRSGVHGAERQGQVSGANVTDVLVHRATTMPATSTRASAAEGSLPPISVVPATRRATPRCCLTTGSSPSAAPTPPAYRRRTSGSCATCPMAPRTPTSGRAGSSSPTSSARAIRPTPSPSSPTARSSSPGLPPAPPGSTPTSRWSATTPTDRLTAPSVMAVSSPPIWAPRTTMPARLAIQADGKIVLAGSAGEDIGLVRLQPNGGLDPTFGTLGKSVTDLGFEDVANGVALTRTGGILIAGSTVGANRNQDFLLAGFRADGSLNLGFGHFGWVTTDFGDGDDFAEDLTLDAQGGIVVVGRAASPTISDLAVVEYTADGTVGGAITTVDFHGRGDFGQDVALDSDGRIVAAGYTANGGDTEFALTRVNP